MDPLDKKWTCCTRYRFVQLCVDSITHNPKIIYLETSHHPKQGPVATGPKGYNEAEQNKTYSRKL
jgi:hypothetical protein